MAEPKEVTDATFEEEVINAETAEVEEIILEAHARSQPQ